MSTETPRQGGTWRQTRVLLYKNCLIKWRTKRTSIQEILIPLSLLGLLIIISMIQPNKRHGRMPDAVLYSTNRTSISEFIVGYTPVNNVTRKIMHKMFSEFCPEGKEVQEFLSEQEMKEASLLSPEKFIGVIFKDSMSYHLKVPQQMIPLSSSHLESTTSCSKTSEMCEAEVYWYHGFTALQICIDAAIIEFKTNHSILKVLEETEVVIMGKSASVEIDYFFRGVILIYLVIAFSPFGYYLTIHIMTEKEKKLKEFLIVMGLQDTAFWLSWVLLYSSLIFVMSFLMSVIATFSSLFPQSSSFVIFLLFFLYGISSISFAFMLTSLFKKSSNAGSAQYFTTVAFGAIGVTIVLLQDFPKSFVWSLSPLCECTFLVGVAQVIHLEDFEHGAVFSTLTHGPYPLIIALTLLALDSMLYLLLGIYFDQVIPGAYGLRRSFFFFLKPSFWIKKPRNYEELYESCSNEHLDFTQVIEPIPSEFRGKEAIRAVVIYSPRENNPYWTMALVSIPFYYNTIKSICMSAVKVDQIKKETSMHVSSHLILYQKCKKISHIEKSFVKKDEIVEALKNLSFDIYEGQITALLGHSGTGKTTLMNILCGLCPPSDGFASIYGYQVSEIDEMLDVRKIMGVCQQIDIFFDVLTVEENLSIIASVKGIPPNDVIQEVQNVLLDLDMQFFKDNQAKILSGGQKRKLSVGFAVLGDPKVLLLDEPTTGMDPCSRQTVWNLLKNRKANSVTVFSTHFMDEADIVADRKAVISRGMLKCLGSSLFLKTKWGIGYRLSMQIDRYCNTEGTAFLIRQHIPGASLLKETEEQLVYALPYKDTDRFSALFADLDTHSHLGVISYGLSTSTLEDVFFKLEIEAETDQQDFGVFNSQQAEDKMNRNSADELEQSLLMLSMTKSCAVSNKSLWKKQALVIAKVHFCSFNRDIKSMSEVLALFLVFLCVEVFMFHMYEEYLKNAIAPIKLYPDLYFLKPNETHHKYKTSLLIQNFTGINIDDMIINPLQSQNILTEMFNGSDYVSVSPHNAALNVVHVSKNYIFKAAFNRTMLHSLPLMMNIISNLYLHNLNVTESIHVWISSFIQEINDRSFIMVMIVQCLTVGVTMTGLPSYFTMENAENHRIKAYTQLKLSGLYPSAYWCGQALVDIPLYYTILLVMTGILFGVYHEIIFSPMKIFAVAFCIMGYVPSVILFHYIVSFTFKSIQNTKEFWSFIFPTAALICIIVTDVAFIKWYTVAIIIHMSFCIFVPIYPLIGCLITLLEETKKIGQKVERSGERLLVSIVAPYLQCIIWLFLLRHLEVKHGGKSMRADPFFRAPTRLKACKFLDVSHEDDGDEDVMAEKLKVKEMITCQDCEERPAVLVISLHKEYDGKTDFLLGRKMKKVATNYLSLCVKKGEVLGILGPNGAGKSTLINILAGEVEPSSGQVLMGDYCLGENIMDNSMKYMGYCPQTNPLWPNITLQEHFEIYGAIKGMSASDRNEVIKCFSKALDLKEHLQKRVKKLGAGVKRKLCFALSMLGNPHITLLDEPSTGMDPIAIQHMWKAIRAAFKSKERAAILATHYMAEAEAICDRVAILVSGKLRYIGTVQHLKTKFGRGYFLEMKLKETPESQEKEYLQRKILGIFPNANCLKSFASILAYKIPREDVQSLALVFSKLEEAKHAFNVEEYSFSQATLDQVFVELVKEQEEEDSNFATLNGTISWERSQEDRVIF